MKGFWLRKEECTGCGGCANACPVDAIQLKRDDCGFVYPVISPSCINCNLCEKVCDQRMNLSVRRKQEPDVYAAWSKDSETRFQSTSGGAFSELAQVILNQGGYIAGAAYNSKNLVEHTLVKDNIGLSFIRQSKYVQSEIGYIYREIKKLLEENKMVGFCGAPCQVAGLYAFLGHDYDGLITFDFICRGMNSPKAYEAWLHEIEDNHKTKVTKVWFKYKQGGWKKSPYCTKIDFKNGTSVILDQEQNLFMTGYLGPNLYIRPCCGNCDFKGSMRQGDITLGDFWGVDTLFDDDKGTSMVLVNSEKGEKIFEKTVSRMYATKRNLQEVYSGNVCFRSSVKRNPKSDEFLLKLDEIPFSIALKKYGKVSFIHKVKQYIHSRY